MYIFGGYDGSNRLNDFWEFQFGTDLTAISIPKPTILDDLRAYVGEESLSDITFLVEGQPVHAHKILLMRCPYFRAMLEVRDLTVHVSNRALSMLTPLGPFALVTHSSPPLQGGFRESTEQRTIPLLDVSRPIFLALLSYIYTDSADGVELDMAMDLFQAADQFGVDRLKMICEHKMLSSISVENAATIFHAADVHSAKGLREKCLNFILANFEQVSKSKSFEEMARVNVELVLTILKLR